MAGTTQGTLVVDEAGWIKYNWPAIINGNQGNKMISPTAPDKTVHITGTFGAGGSVSIEGSNDGTNWIVIKDTDNTALTFAAAAVKLMREVPLYIRPNVTAGDGTTAINVTIVAPARRH